MHKVYIALGSNLDNPLAQVRQGIKALSKLPTSQLLQSSPLYQSQPLGPKDQPNFINAVAKIVTALEPLELLHHLQNIEQQQGRIRTRHWGERTLDLDILLFDDLVLTTPELTIPHYDMHNRSFVLVPLHDLEPNLRLPNDKLIEDLLNKIPSLNLRRI